MNKCVIRTASFRGPGQGQERDGGSVEVGGNQRGDMGGQSERWSKRRDRWQRVWRVKRASKRARLECRSQSGAVAAGGRQEAGAMAAGGAVCGGPSGGWGGRGTGCADRLSGSRSHVRRGGVGWPAAAPREPRGVSGLVTVAKTAQSGAPGHAATPDSGERKEWPQSSQLLCTHTLAHRLPCGLWMGSGPRCPGGLLCPLRTAVIQRKTRGFLLKVPPCSLLSGLGEILPAPPTCRGLEEQGCVRFPGLL